MVKLVYCLRRRAGVSLREFYRHWLDTHVFAEYHDNLTNSTWQSIESVNDLTPIGAVGLGRAFYRVRLLSLDAAIFCLVR